MIDSNYILDCDFQLNAFRVLEGHMGSSMQVHHFKKTDLLLPGSRADRFYFLEKGLARSFYIDEKGYTSTLYFIEAGNFFFVVYPFIAFGPEKYNIEFLEASVARSVDIDSLQALLRSNPELDLLAKKIIIGQAIVAEDRCRVLRYTSAKQRYDSFRSMHPELNRKLASNDIASYLNLAPETLSRIRRKC